MIALSQTCIQHTETEVFYLYLKLLFDYHGKTMYWGGSLHTGMTRSSWHNAIRIPEASDICHLVLVPVYEYYHLSLGFTMEGFDRYFTKSRNRKMPDRRSCTSAQHHQKFPSMLPVIISPIPFLYSYPILDPQQVPPPQPNRERTLETRLKALEPRNPKTKWFNRELWLKKASLFKRQCDSRFDRKQNNRPSAHWHFVSEAHCLAHWLPRFVKVVRLAACPNWFKPRTWTTHGMSQPHTTTSSREGYKGRLG